MKKLISFMLILISLLILAGCGCETPKPQGPCIEIGADGVKSQRGQLWGEISIKNTGAVEYDIYFGDSQGNVLEGYTKIGTCTETLRYKMEGLVIPPEAKSITAIDNNGGRCSSVIPSEFMISAEDVFVFGALADVHYNRYSASGEDDALVAFDTALDYFDRIGADFVGIAGDISVGGEKSAFEKYNAAIKERGYPVYTVTGNHDVASLGNGLWKESISGNIKGCEFSENGLDFIYAPEEMGGDVFVFLNQVRWEYNTDDSTILDQSQLQWLGDVLERYKEETVYLFFHTFLCGPDGQGHTGVGNVKNPGGHSYDLPYTYEAADETVFRSLMKEYKNVVYFSGHSHWLFEMECYGDWANFSNFDGEYCYMVHVPSVTAPRYMGEYDTTRTNKNTEFSQGWVLYDYGDTVILVPVDFISGTHYTEYMEIIYQ